MEPLSLGSLAVWLHPATSTPRARVLIVHGICEHSGRHLPTVEFLTRAGFETVRFDLRGAGKSGGKRQHVQKWEDYVEDVVQVFNWICRERDPLPLVVLGHSMGGAVAAYFAKNYQKHLRALVLSAPAYLIGGAVSPIKISVGKLLGNVIPTLKVAGGDDRTAISRDPGVVEAYYSDPLSCHFNTVRQGNEVLRGIAAMPKICAEINLPTLFVHGTADRIIRFEGSFELLKVMKGPFRQLHAIPGGYHEPHNDVGREEYFNTLVGWLSPLCD
jgi:alpha-beta hydrolase superfamily lysophospholipase